MTDEYARTNHVAKLADDAAGVKRTRVGACCFWPLWRHDTECYDLRFYRRCRHEPMAPNQETPEAQHRGFLHISLGVSFATNSTKVQDVYIGNALLVCVDSFVPFFTL